MLELMKKVALIITIQELFLGGWKFVASYMSALEVRLSRRCLRIISLSFFFSPEVSVADNEDEV
jgi:NADH:ubiquinone oxidoreductase subunit H